MNARPLLTSLAALSLFVASFAADAANNSRRTRTSTTTTTTLALSGSPSTAVVAGSGYSFTPTLTNTGSTAAFSIQNKPSWATFSTATGKLSGTPAAASVGTYASITIAASNGTKTATLPAFSISVTAPVVTGTATLYWLPPTLTTTGEALTDLAGFKLYAGPSSGSQTQIAQLANAATTSYAVSNLASGTWYFSISAYTNTGVESDRTGLVSTTIP